MFCRTKFGTETVLNAIYITAVYVSVLGTFCKIKFGTEFYYIYFKCKKAHEIISEIMLLFLKCFRGRRRGGGVIIPKPISWLRYCVLWIDIIICVVITK